MTRRRSPRQVSRDAQRSAFLRAGMGLIETMMSLVIIAGLLLALGTAFRAASNAVEYNDDYFRAAQAVRVAMARITTQIRRADACSITGTNVLSVITTDVTTGAVTTDVFTYNSAAQTITVAHTLVSGTSTTTSYVLPVKFSQAAFTSASNANGTVVSLVLKATVAGMPISLSGSASPRKLLAY